MLGPADADFEQVDLGALDARVERDGAFESFECVADGAVGQGDITPVGEAQHGRALAVLGPDPAAHPVGQLSA